MAHLPTFTPAELASMVDCSLQYHFWRQSANHPPDPLNTVVLDTIQHLHAGGGPNRLNLPATLRFLASQLANSPSQDQNLITAARQMVATYHRRLRDEWPRIIAANELLTLNIALKRTPIRCEMVIDRVDKEDDGGISAIRLITDTEPMSDFLPEETIEATMWHALIAAAYPGKRPVRLVKRWLFHNQEERLQLTENAYRQNLEKIKNRANLYLEGEILARPGSHCEVCPFQYNGCPIYLHESEEDDE